MNVIARNARASVFTGMGAVAPMERQDVNGNRWLVFVKICLGERTRASRVDHDWRSESAVRAMVAEIADRRGCIRHLGVDGVLVEFLDLDIALNCALALHRRSAYCRSDKGDDSMAQYLVGIQCASDADLADEAVKLAASLSERLGRLPESRGIYLFPGDGRQPGDAAGGGLRIVEDPAQPGDGGNEIRVRMSAVRD